MPRDPSFDPFGLSTDPRRYLPLRTSERALEELRAAIQRRRSPLHLEGPSGVGKTLLLRVLEERERGAGRRVVFSPFLHLPADEIETWLCHLIGESTAPCEEAGRTRAGAALGRLPTLLVVDELQGASVASVRRLVEIAQTAGPGLALLTAGRTGWRAEVPSPAALIRLPATLPVAELAALCDARLAQPGVDPALARLAPIERGRILAACEGVPALLEAELESRAASVARGRAWALIQEVKESGPLVREPALLTPSTSTPAARPPSTSAPATTGALVPAWTAQREPVVAAGARPSAAAPVPRRAREIRERAARAWSTRALAPALRAREQAKRAWTRTAERSESVLRWCARQSAVRLERSRAWARETWPRRVQHAHDVRRHLHARTRALALRARERGERAWASAGRGREDALRWCARQAAIQLERANAWARETSPRQVQHARELAHRLSTRAAPTALRARALAERAWASAADRSASALRELAPQPSRLLGRAVAFANTPTESARLVAGLVLLALAISLVARGCERRAEASAEIAAIRGPSPVAEPVKLPAAAISDGGLSEPERVAVQVNAQPWAWVRIDGVALGSTPLTHELSVGEHELEAEFADGRRLRRRIEVGPTQRFVALR
jgi:hypothetical protein